MRIASIGLGRTGKSVANYLWEREALCAVFCRDESDYAGNDLGHVLQTRSVGIPVTPLSALEETLLVVRPDVLIDFSGASFLRKYLSVLEKHGVHIVTAVTDFTDIDVEKLKRTGERARIGIIWAPNITYGVNVMMSLAQIATKMMQDYDFEIIEEHHNKKRDIPSGTAKKVAHKIERIFKKYFSYGEKTVPVHSIRSGGIVGKHKLIIAGKYDKVEISHESIAREAFAEGAYKAAAFIQAKKGYFEMEDVFAEKSRQQALFSNAIEPLSAM